MAVAVSVESTKLSGRPFTRRHFRAWAQTLTLDSGEQWNPDAWQLDWIDDLFAGYTECWLVVPEENGKTTLFGGVGLYHIEYRSRAYVAFAAASREQATWGYLQAEGLVTSSGRTYHRERNPGGFRCLEGYRRILCPSTAGRMQVHAADEATGDGIIPTLCLVDELHRHKSLGLYRTWVGKLRKRGAQAGVISTAGEPGAEFEETRKTIRQTAEKVSRRECYGRFESGRLVMHEFSVPADQVNDLRVVKAANPLSTHTVETLREKRTSVTMTPSHWARFVCNIPTRGDDAAISEIEWEAAQTDREIPKGEPVWAGLDLGWKFDTTALVPLWIPQPAGPPTRRGRRPVAGGLRLLGEPAIIEPPRDGTSLDPALVEAALYDLHCRNPIHTVVMDMTKGEQLAAWIESELGARVVDRGTGNEDAAADYESWMEALRGRQLRHNGHPVLRQHVLNAITRMLGPSKARFDRPKASRTVSDAVARLRVIDALTAGAAVHAVAAAEIGRPKRKPMASWG